MRHAAHPGAAPLLLHGARCLLTMDANRRELEGASLLIVDGQIREVGPLESMDRSLVDASERLDVSGCLVTPGLINTHHHMFQSLTRVVRRTQSASLFDWLSGLYPVWMGLTPDMIRVSAELAMAELMRSGCTTSSDHLYLFHNGIGLDELFEAAEVMGMRLHACRGSISLGCSSGGLAPDALVEREADVLRASQRAVERWHDPAPGSMRQVALAPCSPFSVSGDLMRESASLARDLGIRLHTHLAESERDVVFCRQKFGSSPVQHAASLGWIGEDVWHAHCVQIGPRGIDLLARSGTGVSHCPCSNMRLGAGIAPVPALRSAGVPVALGVDGSASNDGASLLAEARQALLLARVAAGAGALSARDALEMATLAGAQVLGRDDIGVLAPGFRADVAVFDLDSLEFAGSDDDPVAALVLCTPGPVRDLIVDGRLRIRSGRFVDVDTGALITRHRQAAAQLLSAC